MMKLTAVQFRLAASFRAALGRAAIRPESHGPSTRLYLIDWAEKRIKEIFWIPELVIECDALDKALLRISKAPVLPQSHTGTGMGSKAWDKALAVIEKYYPSL